MMKQIWNSKDTTNFLVTVYDRISEKCGYGDRMEALTHAERVFYITQTLEAEVNNGGFSQFFFNSSGDFSGELAQAFTEIGAVRIACLCEKALEAFGRELPVDRDERVKLLNELESEETEEILDDCDDAFYEYPEDLNSLSYAYIMKNKAAFEL